mmetsp:Transcript_11980/g.32890  ORF Transcript_11980/g.32890 Transcript_11980/m.32890 type:complete len:248 (+) Transcript_11980:1287-2030(+)
MGARHAGGLVRPVLGRFPDIADRHAIGAEGVSMLRHDLAGLPHAGQQKGLVTLLVRDASHGAEVQLVVAAVASAPLSHCRAAAALVHGKASRALLRRPVQDRGRCPQAAAATGRDLGGPPEAGPVGRPEHGCRPASPVVESHVELQGSGTRRGRVVPCGHGVGGHGAVPRGEVVALGQRVALGFDALGGAVCEAVPEQPHVTPTLQVETSNVVATKPTLLDGTPKEHLLQLHCRFDGEAPRGNAGED